MKMELWNLFRYVDQHTCTLASFSARMKRIYWRYVCVHIEYCGTMYIMEKVMTVVL